MQLQDLEENENEITWKFRKGNYDKSNTIKEIKEGIQFLFDKGFQIILSVLQFESGKHSFKFKLEEFDDSASHFYVGISS